LTQASNRGVNGVNFRAVFICGIAAKVLTLLSRRRLCNFIQTVRKTCSVTAIKWKILSGIFGHVLEKMINNETNL